MQRRNARRICLSAALSLVLVAYLAACGMSQTNQRSRIYDDDEKIVNPYNDFYIEGATQELDGRELTGKFDKMEGMVILWAYEADTAAPVDLVYHITVTEGKAKLVFIYPDNTMMTLAECSNRSGETGDTEVVLSVKKGLNRIKIVCDEGTALEYKITVSEGELRTI